jgi:predicted transcriptional regulator of viral defense system
MASKRDSLKRMILENDGIILTQAVTTSGISRDHLSRMTRNGELERVARGVYLAKNCFDDEMFRLQRKYGRAIFSHETALFLHDLSDREPMNYCVTVPTGYNAGKLKAFPASVFFIGRALYPLGAGECLTAFGRKISCYDMERALCDVIRNRSRTDTAVLTDALKRYARRRDKNISKLMEYAENFSVAKLTRTYMEVLL